MMISALLPVARPAIAAAAIVLLAVLSASSTAYGTFTPEFDMAVADTTPEATSDITFNLDLPAGDANFAGVVGFMPGDWGIVRGEAVPIGAIVGHIDGRVTLGLVGSACNTELPVEFNMVNASIDIDDTVSFNDTNKDDFDNTRDYAKDVNPENGLYDGFDRYPEFNNRVFDTDNLQPIRRTAGISIVAGIPLLLQFLTFPPGTPIDGAIPNDITILGYPVAVLFQDFGDPQTEAQPGAITDFCTPLRSTTTFFGIARDNDWTAGVDEGGAPLLFNPQDGRYTFAAVSSGLRDADGDSYENALDTCPYDTNAGNPRISQSGDIDQDGLDAACDPNDDPATGGTNSDEDGDGYLNRQDNCPLVMNGEDLTNQADADLDQIGDVCDQHPFVPDGESLTAPLTSNIVIGTGTGTGGPPDCPAQGCWSPPTQAEPNANGNVDCDGDIDTVDSLKTLRYVAQLPFSQTQPCPLIGADVASLWGDVDCNGAVTSVDALKILRFVAELAVSQTEPCTDVGAPEG